MPAVYGLDPHTSFSYQKRLETAFIMKIHMVCLEDGVMSCGFRKMAAYVRRLNKDTHVHYISTNNYRSFRAAILGTYGHAHPFEEDSIKEIAEALAGADLIGFSSMTGYSELTRRVINGIREKAGRRPFLLWGGIHPIIHPENAIQADVDAICNGEGELAFEQFLDLFRSGKDFTSVRNMWFKQDGKITRNCFLPLMSGEEMDKLPLPDYGKDELIYKKARGFVPLGIPDYIQANGLSYNTVWSIGCPFHCTYCGNTKFIANDPKYKKIRHPSVRFAIEEAKTARARHPHISTICFHDDSFLALPLPTLEEFSVRWREEVGLPFAIYGVIPNYVRKDKIEVLTWAGMNRIRMGIQSGSQRILDFYKRPTPVAKVEHAASVCATFTHYHIPPSFDFIMDNPIETREDVVATLELAYRLARPFTMNLFSLKVIPNTDLEKSMREAGINMEEISENYSNLPPRWANIVMYILATYRPPRWLFDRLLTRVEASAKPQKLYPLLGVLARTMFLAKRGIDHLRFMDFSVISGYGGYFCWKIGLVGLFQKIRNRALAEIKWVSKPAAADQITEA